MTETPHNDPPLKNTHPPHLLMIAPQKHASYVNDQRTLLDLAVHAARPRSADDFPISGRHRHGRTVSLALRPMGASRPISVRNYLPVIPGCGRRGKALWVRAKPAYQPQPFPALRGAASTASGDNRG